jgi:3-methyladenine DNA glycosylase AlkD
MRDILSSELASLRAALAEAGDAEAAVAMKAYMRDQFPFFGVQAPARRALQRPLARVAKGADRADLLALAEALWAEPERELQLVAADLLRAGVGRLEARDLPRVGGLILDKSWWDTVDILAIYVVGGLVRAHRELVSEMDRWAASGELWLARSAVIHQNAWGADTDAARLFGYCDDLAGHTDFFIRKALGWALRDYAKVDPEAVRRYLTSRGEALSGLTRREAAKHL